MREDDPKSLLIGAGLAFGFGWLWFPWLASSWSPGLLWGRLGSASGSTAFILLLILGFPVGGILAAHFYVSGEDAGWPPRWFRQNIRHAVHGCAYLLLAAALLLRIYGPVVLPGIWPYTALPAVAAAYILMGLYWCGRIMSLSPLAAPTAFLFAVLFAAIAGQAIIYLPLRIQWLLCPHSLLVAWAIAEYLAVLEKPLPRGRGRPPKLASEPSPIDISGTGQKITPHVAWTRLAAVLAAIGFIGGAAWGLNGKAAVNPPWLTGLAYALGALIPALLVRRQISSAMCGLLSVSAVSLFLVLAAAALLVWPPASAVFMTAGEGALAGVGLALLADRFLEKGMAVRQTGMVVGLYVLLINGGWLVGKSISGMAWIYLVIPPALAAGPTLTWLSLRFFRRKAKHEIIIPANAGNGARNAASEGNTPPLLNLDLFTPEELRLIELLSREELRNQDIADLLFIARPTVRYHLRKLYAKTNTANREDLVNFVSARCALHNKSLKEMVEERIEGKK